MDSLQPGTNRYMRILSTEQLGPKQSLTPEGFLLCEAVPIARTGTQMYAGMELPDLMDGLDGLITVVREESEVFSPETMASFEGKPITIGHAFVDPTSWADLAKGTVQNVRRGLDADSDLLLADLLITDAEAIALVRVELDDKGRPVPGQTTVREVSCGYDAQYQQEAAGVAFQRNIIGNHVALVPRGRAGPRCSIQDEETMSTKTNQPTSLVRRLITAARTGDLALIKRTADAADDEETAAEQRAADEEAEAERKETKDTLANIAKTVDALVQTVAALAKTRDSMPEGQQSSAENVAGGSNPVGDEEGDDKDKTKDGEPDAEEKQKTADAMSAIVSRAEILAPGFKVPTTDSVRRLAQVAGVQRQVLAAADKALIAPLLSGRTVDSLPAAEVGIVFTAATELARQANNAAGTRMRTGDQHQKTGVTPADINARNASFWANR